MSSALRRLFLCALTSLPLLVGTTFAYADDVEEDETEEEEADDDATTTITIDGGYADTDPSAVTVYNTELQPYGVWVSDARYGTVWVPNQADVGVDFAPYQSAGHWELTADDEWLWVSDYSWGYIPFHYGRWVWIEQTGWAWIPGRAYAPAWVVWRTGSSGYIGWAPMPPAYYWMGGVYHTCSPPVAAYVFVSTTYVYDVHVHSHIYRERADVERAVSGTEQHKSGTPHYGPSQPSPQEAHVTPPTSRAKPSSKALDLAKPKATTSSAGKGTVSVAKPKKATQAKSGSTPKPATVSRPPSTAVVSKPTTTTTRSSGTGTTSTSTPTVTKRTTKRSTKAVTAPSTPKTVTVTTPAPPQRTVTRTVTPKPVVSTPKTTSTPKPASPTPRPVVVSKPSTSTPAPAARKSSPTVTRRSHKR